MYLIRISVTVSKVQVCEANWIRIIVEVKRADKRRMDELKEEVGVMESFQKKLVKRRLIWAGHVEIIGNEINCSKKSRCPESGGENEARKTEKAMGGLL